MQWWREQSSPQLFILDFGRSVFALTFAVGARWSDQVITWGWLFCKRCDVINNTPVCLQEFKMMVKTRS